MNDADLGALRRLATYQFGSGAGEALFPPQERLAIERSSSGRPRQVRAEAGRVVSLGLDGRFTLGIEGGRRLLASVSSLPYQVVVGDESEPYVLEGKNVFAKFVRSVGDDVRGGDEVVVRHERGDVLAVGRAEVDAGAMRDFETGMAVMVRESAERDAA
ncbi:MAG: PUA domain-containing protein [Halanaeroarchaeum sp.]